METLNNPVKPMKNKKKEAPTFNDFITTKNQFTEIFAPIIWNIIKAHNDINEQDNEQVIKAIEGLLTNAIQKWTDRPVDMISEKFHKLAIEKKEDPWSLLWKDRKVFGKIYGKSIAVWEHTTPISEFRTTLLTSKTFQDVKNHLNEYSGVCWITREEDEKLNNHGFRNKRPNGWEYCYDLCVSNVVHL